MLTFDEVAPVKKDALEKLMLEHICGEMVETLMTESTFSTMYWAAILNESGCKTREEYEERQKIGNRWERLSEVPE